MYVIKSKLCDFYLTNFNAVENRFSFDHDTRAAIQFRDKADAEWVIDLTGDESLEVVPVGGFLVGRISGHNTYYISRVVSPESVTWSSTVGRALVFDKQTADRLAETYDALVISDVAKNGSSPNSNG